jgi:AcrR family transcriptional regulator
VISVKQAIPRAYLGHGNDRRQGHDRRAAKEVFLDRAAALFASAGYVETHVVELARGLGLSKPQLYKHVGTKAEIFELVWRREVARFVESVIAPLERSTAAGLTASPARIITYFWRLQSSRCHTLALLFGGHQAHTVRDEQTDLVLKTRSVICASLCSSEAPAATTAETRAEVLFAFAIATSDLMYRGRASRDAVRAMASEVMGVVSEGSCDLGRGLV